VLALACAPRLESTLRMQRRGVRRQFGGGRQGQSGRKVLKSPANL
jgi:hypothetical protein